MSTQDSKRSVGTALALVTLLLGASGCEMDSYLTTGNVGRWEVTPTTLPILKKLDVIEEEAEDPPNLTPVMPADLEPEPEEYVIGIGDVLTITVLSLVEPGSVTGSTGRVDDLGIFRHEILGDFKVVGYTARELEEKVSELTRKQGRVKDPEVHIYLRRGQGRTYSIIGNPRVGGVRLGTYGIPMARFTLLDATAAAGGIPGSIQNIYIIRRATMAPEKDEDADRIEIGPPPIDPATEIIEIIQNGADYEDPQKKDEPAGKPAPKALEDILDDPQPASNYIHVDGKWIEVDAAVAPAQGTAGSSDDAQSDTRLPDIVQRVIEVPYHLLRKGDLRYNVIIRPGDIIRVPAPVGGNVYLMGSVARPGTYALPGENRLTMRRLMAASGGFGAGSIPERVDLTRRIGTDQEATVRLNLREIFHGHEPDFYLKPDDTINVGTSFMTMPLTLIRRGVRLSYGFGFILDRNFANDVFGPQTGGRRN